MSRHAYFYTGNIVPQHAYNLWLAELSNFWVGLHALPFGWVALSLTEARAELARHAQPSI